MRCPRPTPGLAALLAALVAACAASPAAEAPPLEPPLHVLLLGDSISIGYHADVVRSLGDRATVVRPMDQSGQRAENCAGTTKGVANVGRWLELDGGGWDVVHFNFGLHDLKRVDAATRENSNDPSDPPQAAPDVYGAQLREITAALAATGARLVFATTTPVPPGGVRPHRDTGDPALYNGVARSVMAEFGVPIDDLHAFVEPRMAELMRPVNVHFTPEGSAALGEEVSRSIQRAAGWVPTPPRP